MGLKLDIVDDILPIVDGIERTILNLLLLDMWTLIAAGFGKKTIMIHRPTFLLNGKVHARVVKQSTRRACGPK